MLDLTNTEYMKTANFKMDLMVPLQENKEIVFNESIIKIDNLLLISAESFTADIPTIIETGKKYIITKGDHKSGICYKSLSSKPITIQPPVQGMVIFVIEENCFFCFHGNSWKQIGSSPSIPANFTAISGDYDLVINRQINYLYLDSDTNLNITDSPFGEVTLIIKQTYNQISKLHWQDNILWENKTSHKITAVENSIDIVKLYKLPETGHFLGRIIARNFNY